MNNKSDLTKMFTKLNNLGFSRIFIESGVTFLKFLIKNNFINNLYIFISQSKININGLNKFEPLTINKTKLSKKINVNLFGDYVKKIKLK